MLETSSRIYLLGQLGFILVHLGIIALVPRPGKRRAKLPEHSALHQREEIVIRVLVLVLVPSLVLVLELILVLVRGVLVHSHW
jgi:hypothetical protein